MTSEGMLSIDAAAADAPDGIALIDTDGTATTWADLRGRAISFASAFQNDRPGGDLQPGEVVAFVASPTPTTFTLIHALVAIGQPFVPIHPRLTPGEVESLLAAIGPARLLSEYWISAVYPKVVGASPQRVGVRGGPIPDDERTLAVLASSGTTGTPKGVILSRRAFVESARASEANLPLCRGNRWIACMPLAHAGGLSILTRALIARSAVILLPRFHLGAIAAAVSMHGGTHLSVVPTMLRELVEKGKGGALGSLEAVLVGGAACPDGLLAEARRQGIPALATYGLTEACSQVTTQPLSDRERIPDGDSGLPLTGTEIAVLDEAGDRLESGREGLIAVRGPTLATGYRGHPTHDRDAWLATGDYGLVREDGRLVILARRTDLVVTGGENAYPAEIEGAIRALEGVRDCAVVGVPDERWGEVVGAVIDLDFREDVERILSPLASRLAPHKLPRRLVIATEPLPRTAKGEIDRAEVRRRYAAELAAAAPTTLHGG